MRLPAVPWRLREVDGFSVDKRVVPFRTLFQLLPSSTKCRGGTIGPTRHRPRSGRRPMSLADRTRDSLRIAASLGGALVVWEAAVRLLQIPVYILPPPSQVLADLARSAYIVAPAALYTLQP